MTWPGSRSLASVAVVAAISLTTACNLDFDRPPPIPSCIGTERPLTGILGEDIIGGWVQDVGRAEPAHPITRFGPANIILVFDDDGTGTAEWLAETPSDWVFGDTSFTWRVEGDMLVVDDYPPAAIRMEPSAAFVSNPDGRGGTALWSRCELRDE